MKLHRSRFASLLALLILVAMIAISTRGQSPLRAIGSVTDGFSGPIAGAHITLYSLDRILQATSDTAGRYQFDGLPTGVYEFEVVSPGFKTITTHDLHVTDLMRSVAGNKPLEFNIVMALAASGTECGRRDTESYNRVETGEGSSVNGVALVNNGPSKSPIANAHVLLYRSEAKVSEQQTNERGEFHFKSVAPGRYLIVIQHPKYKELKSDTFWVARENQTYITLEPVPVGMIVVCQ
ncbi:MAG TPA: carboxypeptidase-like regulatory domain-containing protein [Pyrinomonadaceae bacterium]|nr:carboxypeptidase-like regulatory domain-containing protein [Pyrinomonadaceae bacterium]